MSVVGETRKQGEQGRWGTEEMGNRGDEFLPSAPCPIPNAP